MTQTRMRFSLDGVWDFKLLEAGGPQDAKSPLADSILMPVPSSYNDIYEGRDFRDHVGDMVYEREVMVTPAMKSGRLVLRFDKAACLWRSLGTPAEVEQAALASGYDADPLVQTVLRQVDAGGGKWQTNAKGFIAACEDACGSCPVETGQALGKALDKRASLLRQRSGVSYRAQDRGTAGRLYIFRTAAPSLPPA